jgi:PhnB protein
MTTINPYLTFNGNCEEAFNFYRSVFGGEFAFSGKFKDMPENPDYPVSEADKEKIMHIALPISKETYLLGSDSSEAFGKSSVQGNNMSISINTSSIEEVDRIFSGLSSGGQVKMPLEKTFWGAYFGMFIDKFGIHWSVNCELEEHKDFEEKHRLK